MRPTGARRGLQKGCGRVCPFCALTPTDTPENEPATDDSGRSDLRSFLMFSGGVGVSYITVNPEVAGSSPVEPAIKSQS